MKEKNVQWKLVVQGWNELSEADKVFALEVIAENLEVFGNFEGSFSITDDEEDLE